MRIELTTSSLPRKCSTTELQQLFFFRCSSKLQQLPYLHCYSRPWRLSAPCSTTELQQLFFFRCSSKLQQLPYLHCYSRPWRLSAPCSTTAFFLSLLLKIATAPLPTLLLTTLALISAMLYHSFFSFAAPQNCNSSLTYTVTHDLGAY